MFKGVTGGDTFPGDSRQIALTGNAREVLMKASVSRESRMSPKPFLLSLVFASLCSAPGWCTIYNVTNTADSGAGSLRQDVTNANAGGGTNTITWTAGSGGTITLGSALSINGNNTLDVTGAPSAAMISGATTANTLGLGGAVTFANASAFDWTITAGITGTGSLTKTGAGKLILTGGTFNTYSGGTILNAGILSVDSDASLGNTSGGLTFNGGTLQTAASISSARGITLNGSGTFDTNGLDSSLTGVISGTGLLVKNGAGMLNLRGSNTYSGGTLFNSGKIGIDSFSELGSGGLTFNGGTLQTQASLSSGVNITLNAGGGSIDTAGSTSTLSGTILGVGGLTKLSSGTLVLSGVNTYVGGTTISGGVLQVSNDQNLGDTAGAITLNGGILQTAAAITTARSVVLGAGNGTIDTDGYDSTFSGAFSGVGGLTKIGSGILTLSGNNSYSGGTAVSAGTLQYGVDNALPTNGALTVASGATVDLYGFSQNQSLGLVTNNGLLKVGAGTLLLNNGYQGSGTLKLQLSPGLTNITGTSLNFTGGTLSVSLGGATVANGQKFTPIQASNPNTGTFTTITAPAALSFTPLYNSTSVDLLVQFVPFASLAATPNQSAVGAALEPARTNPTGDLAKVMGSLYSLNQADLQSALDRIGPIALAPMASLGLAADTVYAAAVGRRADALTEKAQAIDASGALRPATSSEEAGWSYFVSPLYTRGSVSAAVNDSGAQPSYTFNTGGIALGSDYRFGDKLASGVSAGFTRSQSSNGNALPGSVGLDSVRLGLYTAGALGAENELHGNAYLGGTEDFYSTSRGIAFADQARTANGRAHGHQINADTNLSLDVRAGDSAFLSPFVGMSFDRMSIGSFNEGGADSLDLRVSAQSAESLHSDVGMQYHFGQYRTEAGVYTAYVSGALRHEFANQNRQIGAQLASGEGNSFAVATGDTGRNGTLLGAGLTSSWSSQTEFVLDYVGDFRPRFTEQTLNASMRYRF